MGFTVKIFHFLRALRYLGRTANITRETAELASQLDRRIVDAGLGVEELREQLKRFESGVAEQRDRLNTLEVSMKKLNFLEKSITNLSDGILRQEQELTERLDHQFRATNGEFRRDLELQQRSYTQLSLRLELLLKEARRRLPEPFDGTQLAVFADAEDPFLVAFYTRFEDRFRGSRDEIKARLKVYLSEIEVMAQEGRDLRIVDLGCGRGEWLELLRDHGLTATGIDLNEVQIADARALGLDVHPGDALAFLEAQPDSSLDAVTSMHVVEHLPFNMLVTLLRHINRVLRPGGLVILETPNPESVVVGAYKFHLDPTHLKPLPPELLSTLVEVAGFSDVRVLRLHPDPRLERLSGRVDGELLDVLFGPRDFAVLARRPD